MGDEITARHYSREERQRYREKVQLCLDVFERMLSSATFESDEENPMTGLEVELNLVDEQRQPFLGNVAVLEEIADPAFQTELGAYNIELNVPPRSLKGDARTRPRGRPARLAQPRRGEGRPAGRRHRHGRASCPRS